MRTVPSKEDEEKQKFQEREDLRLAAEQEEQAAQGARATMVSVAGGRASVMHARRSTVADADGLKKSAAFAAPELEGSGSETGSDEGDE